MMFRLIAETSEVWFFVILTLIINLCWGSARFMPNPLANGSLLLTFTRLPPSAARMGLSIFRPSDFPLGVVGIAACSQSDALTSIYGQFNRTIADLFPHGSIFPLARNCFVFEEGEGNTGLHVDSGMQGMVVIPEMMGNKKLYIGTLLAELCSNILGEFSVMVMNSLSYICTILWFSFLFSTGESLGNAPRK